MWKKPAGGWSGATGGENLEKFFWDDVKNKDFRKINSHVASSFAGSGSGGSFDRAAFLQQLQSYQLTSFSLSECVSRLNGEDVIITCTLQRDGSPSERVNTLSVWQQYKKGWLMVAHSESPLNR
jgi:hypothetical protein